MVVTFLSWSILADAPCHEDRVSPATRYNQTDNRPASSIKRALASRFPSSDAFASYAGVAPIEVSSGERITHRLSRSGDRQLNSALHLVAVTQVRMRNSAGRCYYDRKIAEGKTRNEAMRCLKRRIATHVWRRMLADEQRRQLPPEKPDHTT